jgi:hypothetical protein
MMLKKTILNFILNTKMYVSNENMFTKKYHFYIHYIEPETHNKTKMVHMKNIIHKSWRDYYLLAKSDFYLEKHSNIYIHINITIKKVTDIYIYYIF